MLLGNLHMIEHGEAERPDVDFAVPQLLAGICAADRRFGMREVGHRVVDRRRFGRQRFHVRQNLILQLADAAAVILARFALGIILGLTDRLAHHVRLPRKLFDFGLQLAPLRLEFHEPRNVDLHAAPVAVFLHQLRILQE